MEKSFQTIIINLKHSFAEPHSTFPPRIIDRRTNLIVKEGSTVKLPCAAEGYPIPQIHWLKLEKSQAVRLTKNQRFVELGGTLIIRRAEPEDSGKYICYVNNSVADERVDTELLVSGMVNLNITNQHDTISKNKNSKIVIEKIICNFY
ncbi:ig-like domain-containing protein [Caerostris darwini]|uniref:Ig-like domain-containing protein n=1 Tax=Caerostris darwini TaxID=1538125 RepID=A0AAV4PYU5_9ARAC|nr:ig-like domain-containing protein [Caerostris darwini]